jgi:hypothetical protein
MLTYALADETDDLATTDALSDVCCRMLTYALADETDDFATSDALSDVC